MSRRQFLGATGLVATGVGLTALRPAEQGAVHAAYFATLSKALTSAGLAMPTLVLDIERLRANAARVTANIGGRMALRLVNKSLPCLSLLDELSKLTGTQRQMVFSLPYLQLLSKDRPDSDVLMGKPLPVAAAARFYQTLSPSGFDPARQLQWLVDTPERLAEYRQLARERQQPMRLNFEIDVGLHRGGAADVDTLTTMARLLNDEPLLQWSGLMGYDAHTEKIPEVMGQRQRARQHALDTYRQYHEAMQSLSTRAPAGPLTLNTAGSPTYRLHDGSGAANEVSVGSAMVKASDFDTPLLSDLTAAAFIATPVLKTSTTFTPPYGVEWLGRAAAAWNPNQRGAVFIHGGNWLANPVSPEGLEPSGLIGKSSNQQIFLGSGRQQLHPDDFVFFRPTQSEAVLQQFGDIAVFEKGRITAQWPVFPARV
ncbi:MAG: alanine racemase [Pseudomonadota bacterium]